MTITLAPLAANARYKFPFGGVPKADTLNTQTALSDILKNDSADGKPIPLGYGDHKIGGMPFVMDYDSGTWTVGYILEYGEIEEITSTTLNGEAPKSGVTITEYLGTTSQAADSDLAAAISGYADDLVISDPQGDIGVAYIVVQYTDSHYDSWPSVVCRVKGKKVRNPRKLDGESRYTGNGANYGTLSAITLSGDFSLGVSFTRVDRSLDKTIVLGDDASGNHYLAYNAANHASAADDLLVMYNGTEYAFADALQGLTGDVRAKVSLAGSTLEAWVDGVSVGTHTVTAASFVFSAVGSHNSGTLPMLSGFRVGKIRAISGTNEWRYDIAEGSGSASSNSHPSTGSNDITWTAANWASVSESLEFSENPGAHLSDLIASPIYGLGKSVDPYGAIDVMDRCDDETPGETRRESYLVVDQPQDTFALIDILRAYASCFVVPRGDVVNLSPDMPGESVKTITTADIVRDSLKITKRDTSNMPTVVRAYYTDTSGSEWRERLCDAAKASGVDAGTTPWRESRIRLLGMKRHSQAYRECVERLNKLTVSDVVVTWEMFDEAMTLEEGDIVTITHPYGLTDYKLRIDEPPKERSPGRYRLTASEYRDAAYSDTVQNATAFNDGALPDESLFGPGVTVYKQSTKPTDGKEGDIWIDDSDQNRTHHHDGSDFENVAEALISVDSTAKTANFTADGFKEYLLDTSAGEFTLTFPSAPTKGMKIVFFDVAGTFDVNRLAVDGNGKKVMGETSTLYIDRRWYAGGFRFIDDTYGWIPAAA